MRYGTTAASTSPDTSWLAGAVVSFTYDGTNWILNDYNASSDILKGLKDVGIDGLTTTDGGLGQAINALGWWNDVQL